jgi:hypothetical protein
MCRRFKTLCSIFVGGVGAYAAYENGRVFRNVGTWNLEAGSHPKDSKTPRSRRKLEINKYSVVTDYISVNMWQDLLALIHNSCQPTSEHLHKSSTVVCNTILQTF